ncbi:MAG: flagellar hook-length control protein FliK, partial [Leptospiraceae bacterium]|nr:flagellar hook-length control protein FliK [Leptospiraceae bacterium]
MMDLHTMLETSNRVSSRTGAADFFSAPMGAGENATGKAPGLFADFLRNHQSNQMAIGPDPSGPVRFGPADHQTAYTTETRDSQAGSYAYNSPVNPESATRPDRQDPGYDTGRTTPASGQSETRPERADSGNRSNATERRTEAQTPEDRASAERDAAHKQEEAARNDAANNEASRNNAEKQSTRDEAERVGRKSKPAIEDSESESRNRRTADTVTLETQSKKANASNSGNEKAELELKRLLHQRGGVHPDDFDAIQVAATNGALSARDLRNLNKSVPAEDSAGHLLQSGEKQHRVRGPMLAGGDQISESEGEKHSRMAFTAKSSLADSEIRLKTGVPGSTSGEATIKERSDHTKQAPASGNRSFHIEDLIREQLDPEKWKVQSAPRSREQLNEIRDGLNRDGVWDSVRTDVNPSGRSTQNKQGESGGEERRGQMRQGSNHAIDSVRGTENNVQGSNTANQNSFLNQISNRQNDTAQLEANRKLMNSLVQQARVNVRSDGSSTASIRLNPQSLGHMTLNLRLENNQMTAQILVDNQSARQIIKNEMEHLRAELQRQGIQVENVVIRVRDNQAFQFQGDESQLSGQNMQNGQFDSEPGNDRPEDFAGNAGPIHVEHTQGMESEYEPDMTPANRSVM